jgi:hypothetical protein
MLASKLASSAPAATGRRAQAPLTAAGAGAARPCTPPLRRRAATAAAAAPEAAAAAATSSTPQQMPDLPGIASSVTQLVGNTPMVRLNRLAAAEGAKATVLAKVRERTAFFPPRPTAAGGTFPRDAQKFNAPPPRNTHNPPPPLSLSLSLSLYFNSSRSWSRAAPSRTASAAP